MEKTGKIHNLDNTLNTNILDILAHQQLDPLFWEATRMQARTAWSGHIPFAHWITSIMQPVVFVELGTHTGVSYSAFCEAVQRGKLNTHCYAVDTWEGDHQAGKYGEEVYTSLKQFNQEHYSHFSVLIRSTFDQAVSHFKDKAIDLLHIDGLHTYEAAKHDFMTWLPKLSNKGIILFHDINEKNSDFGVWKLWNELSTQYSSFEFFHAHGLGVLCVGIDVHQTIRSLCSLNSIQKDTIRNRFAYLGARWEATQQQLSLELGNQALYQEKIESAERMQQEIENMQRKWQQDLEQVQDKLNTAIEINHTLNYQLWMEDIQNKSLASNTITQFFNKNPFFRKLFVFLIEDFGTLFTGKHKQLRKNRKRNRKNAAIVAKSPLFDADWYIKTYKDAVYSKMDAALHYATFGKDGRSPSPLFDARDYIHQYPDVAQSDFIPLIHYEQYGKAEYRNIKPIGKLHYTIEENNYVNKLTLKKGNADPYEIWMRTVEKEHIHSLPVSTNVNNSNSNAATSKPRFSIILPTYNTPEHFLKECLNSVIEQTYSNWELCIADDASENPYVKDILNEYAAKDPRIHIIFRNKNDHISAASNSALAIAQGEYIVFLDHDDMLAPHALQEIALILPKYPDAQIFFSDEDKLNEKGKRCMPFFKPDFSIDLFYSQNYICHLCVYKRALIEQVKGFRIGYEGSQDYDLLLRSIALIGDNVEKKIIHIPQILYHWRMSIHSTASNHNSKDYASIAAQKSLQDYFDKKNSNVKISMLRPGLYRQHWPIPSNRPLISLIISTRDGYEDLKECITSILNKTTYKNFEILIIDNQSSDPTTLNYLNILKEHSQIQVLKYDAPFNYSAINNFGVSKSNGSVIGLINNDMEIITPTWLDEMVSHALRPDIGCVGAKLLYPDGTLQHGGVVLGIGGVAGHSHKYFPENADGYFGRLQITHNVSAVTGAALIVRKDIYDQVNGLDEENLPIAFNDIDFCLKVHNMGYRNLWTPFAILTHFESKSRGQEDTPEKRQRFFNEIKVMKTRWQEYLTKDPYYNPNLTLWKEDYSLNV